jgi:hypothetical protein
MKANRIPAHQRLQARVWALELRLHANTKNTDYGMKCRVCRRCLEMYECEHVPGCPIKGLKSEIAHYRRLMDEARGG